MPLPENYRPKEGDELLIRAKVKYDCDPGDDDVHLNPAGAEHKDIIIPLVRVHSLLCRKWKPKDRVRARCTIVVVFATFDDLVWVRLDCDPGASSQTMLTYLANGLQPESALDVPSAQPEPPPPAPQTSTTDDDIPF